MAKKPVISNSTLQQILGKLDPFQAAVMVLGGTAAACGVVPPMTRLLQTFGGSGQDLLDLLLTPGYKLLGKINWFTPGWQQIAETQEHKEAADARLGLFCSGAIEAAIMYALVTNPETFKELMKLPGMAIQGVGKLASLVK